MTSTAVLVGITASVQSVCFSLLDDGCWNPSWCEVITSQPRANLAVSANYAVTRIPQAIIAHTFLLRICLISYLFRSFLYRRSSQGAVYLCLLFLKAFHINTWTFLSCLPSEIVTYPCGDWGELLSLCYLFIPILTIYVAISLYRWLY